MPALLILFVLYALTREEPRGEKKRKCERSPRQRRMDEDDAVAAEALLLSIAAGFGTLGVVILIRFFVHSPFGSWLLWATMVGPGAIAIVTAIAYVTWHSWCRNRRLRKAK